MQGLTLKVGPCHQHSRESGSVLQANNRNRQKGSPGGRSSAGESSRTSHFRLRSDRDSCGPSRGSGSGGGAGSGPGSGPDSWPCSGAFAARRCSAARRASSAFTGDGGPPGGAANGCELEGASTAGGGGTGGGGGKGPENEPCIGLHARILDHKGVSCYPRQSARCLTGPIEG